MVSFPRDRPRAAFSHCHCFVSTRRRTPVSTAISANSSACTSKKGPRCQPVLTPNSWRSRAASRIIPSMRPSVVVVNRLSVITRATMLARAASAFPRVAEDQEAEVGFPVDPVGSHLENAVVGAVPVPVVLLDRHDHLFAPGVGALRGPAVPDLGGPALAVEKPAEAPDGVHG